MKRSTAVCHHLLLCELVYFVDILNKGKSNCNYWELKHAERLDTGTMNIMSHYNLLSQ